MCNVILMLLTYISVCGVYSLPASSHRRSPLSPRSRVFDTFALSLLHSPCVCVCLSVFVVLSPRFPFRCCKVSRVFLARSRSVRSAVAARGGRGGGSFVSFFVISCCRVSVCLCSTKRLRHPRAQDDVTDGGGVVVASGSLTVIGYSAWCFR